MEENELKTDRKIDLLREAGLLNEGPDSRASSFRMQPRQAVQEDDEDVSPSPCRGRPLLRHRWLQSEGEVGTLLSESSRVEEEGESFDLDSDSDVPEEDDSGAEDVPPSSPSPLADRSSTAKTPKPKDYATGEVRVPIKRGSSESIGGLLPTDGEEEEAELSESEATSEGEDVVDEEDEEEDGEDIDETIDEEEDEDQDRYPLSMVDDEHDEAPSWEHEDAPSWRHDASLRTSSSTAASADATDEFSDSPSPPATVKKAKRAPSRAISEESEDELLLSPGKPVRATRASTRSRTSKAK